jgi:hypothetical protein
VPARPVQQPGGGKAQLQPPPQRMPEKPRSQTDDIAAYGVQLDVPGLGRLTRLESEGALKERMRQEALRYGERLVFPDEPILAKEPYPGRHWPHLARLVEPHYVNHGRLLFEQKNFERYGWDLGPITPVLAAGKFFWDVAWLPYHLGTRPCQQYDSSAGHCLPGDPVPFLLYPPELSLTGALTQAGTVAGLFFIFP